MQIIHTSHELAQCCQQWRQAGETIAFVPTMGHYHQGHMDLMRHARTLGSKLVVSHFTNFTQFTSEESTKAYPRDAEQDGDIAASLGVDAFFVPTPGQMFTPDHATWVDAPNLTRCLCGQIRPTHFRGVCTEVMKLFMLTQASTAVFGEKDWQQLVIVKRMVQDLFLPITIVSRPTVRSYDGLALSSRNILLTPEESTRACEIYKGLCFAKSLVDQGETSVGFLRDKVLHRWMERIPQARLDYLTVVQPDTLEILEKVGDHALMACAVRVGKARLIDNIMLKG